nr:MAG TPA: NTP-PPase-like protein [Caudoviricetes sp.]
MTITELINFAWENAEKKGFHKTRDRVDTNYPELSGPLEPHLILAQLALIQSEISEAVHAIQRGKQTPPFSLDFVNQNSVNFPKFFDDHLKNLFPVELADAVIRIADLCGVLGIDLERYIELVLKRNESRPPLHDKIV